MNTICVKLRMREHTNKYRKMLSTNEKIFSEISELIVTSHPYTPGGLLEDGEWFEIANASQQFYAGDVIWFHYTSRPRPAQELWIKN